MSYKISLIRLVVLLIVATGCATPPDNVQSSANNGVAKHETPKMQNVTIRNLDMPGAFEIENTGDDTELDSQVTIERKEGEEWRPLPSHIQLQLIENCETKKTSPSSCLKLGKGEKIAPVPWTGFSCRVQCFKACRKNGYLGPGTFRFVVSSCDKKQKFYSPDFNLPKLAEYNKLKGKKG
jgi:hypothetical protein